MERVEQISSLHEYLEENHQLFHQEFNHYPEFTASAPGRINIIGEHTDYNLGLAMPAGINRWVLISFSERDDRNVEIKSVNFNSRLKFSLDAIPEPKSSWEKYIIGCISVFSEVAQVDSGFNALIWGNVPLGSGVSSSAALEVAMVNGLRSLFNAQIDDFQLVKLCQKVEHQYLHVKSGLLDQYASQFSRLGNVMVLDLQKLHHQYVNLDAPNLEWVLVESGVKRELAHSGYTQRVNETSKALEILKANNNDIHSFRDIKEEHLQFLTDPIQKKRISHYLFENKRVIMAMDAIQAKDFKRLGTLLNESHASLSEQYEVSCYELDFLASKAQEFPQCLGSRMMGGGFGGCSINLVERDALESFSGFIKEAYLKKFGKVPEVDNYSLVEGACIHRFE